MERLRGQSLTGRLGGGLKDLPLCEHCGRPVKVGIREIGQDEIFCPSCAYDARLWTCEDNDEFARTRSGHTGA